MKYFILVLIFASLGNSSLKTKEKEVQIKQEINSTIIDENSIISSVITPPDWIIGTWAKSVSATMP